MAVNLHTRNHDNQHLQSISINTHIFKFTNIGSDSSNKVYEIIISTSNVNQYKIHKQFSDFNIIHFKHSISFQILIIIQCRFLITNWCPAWIIIYFSKPKIPEATVEWSSSLAKNQELNRKCLHDYTFQNNFKMQHSMLEVSISWIQSIKQKEPTTIHMLVKWGKIEDTKCWQGPFHDHTLGKHWKPPPVALSNAKDDILSGAIAASLQAIIAPVLTAMTSKKC